MHYFNEHHPELKGFSAYFDKEIGPLLSARDDERKAILKKVKLYGGGIFLVGVLFAGIAFLMGFWGDAIIGIAMFTGFSGFGMYHYLLKDVSDFTKQKIVGGVCSYVGWSFEAKPSVAPNLKYWADLNLLPSGYVARPIYNDKMAVLKDVLSGSKSLSDFKSDFKDMSANLETDASVKGIATDIGTAMSGRTASIEDQISGHVHGADFSSVEVKLTKKSGKNTITDFHGQLMSLTFPRKFLGRTIVLRDKGWLQGKKKGDMKRVGLVDPVFEDLFEAYSTDQVEARYLLDPVFMQKLIDLEKSVDGRNIRFGFSDSQLFIAVETENRFEAGSMKRSLMAPSRTQKILNEIRAIFHVVDGVMDRSVKR